MTISTTHACRAARISITSMGRHIQNAKFANFPNYVNTAVTINLFVDAYYCYIRRDASLSVIESMALHIFIKAYDKLSGQWKTLPEREGNYIVFYECYSLII